MLETGQHAESMMPVPRAGPAERLSRAIEHVSMIGGVSMVPPARLSARTVPSSVGPWTVRTAYFWILLYW